MDSSAWRHRRDYCEQLSLGGVDSRCESRVPGDDDDAGDSAVESQLHSDCREHGGKQVETDSVHGWWHSRVADNCVNVCWRLLPCEVHYVGTLRGVLQNVGVILTVWQFFFPTTILLWIKVKLNIYNNIIILASDQTRRCDQILIMRCKWMLTSLSNTAERNVHTDDSH